MLPTNPPADRLQSKLTGPPRQAMQPVHEAVSKLLQFEDYSFIDVLLATHVANQSNKEEPVWLMLVGPSSHGKTEILENIATLPGTKILGGLTPRTLISGQIVQGKPAQTVKGVGLLNELDEKTVVIFDGSQILGLRREERKALLGQLRDVFDGRLSYSFGTHNQTQKSQTYTWKGMLGMILALTPEGADSMALDDALGTRFIAYRMPSADPSARRRMGHLSLHSFQKSQGLKQAISDALAQVYASALTLWPTVTIPDPYEAALIALADFVAKARTPVHRDRYRIVDKAPSIEGPGRLIKELHRLLIGLCAVHGVTEPGLPEMAIIAKVGLSCIDETRVRVLEVLSHAPACIAEVTRQVQLPRTTVKRVMEDLATLGILDTAVLDPESDAPVSIHLDCQTILETVTLFVQYEREKGLYRTPGLCAPGQSGSEVGESQDGTGGVVAEFVAELAPAPAAGSEQTTPQQSNPVETVHQFLRLTGPITVRALTGDMAAKKIPVPVVQQALAILQRSGRVQNRSGYLIAD